LSNTPINITIKVGCDRRVNVKGLGDGGGVLTTEDTTTLSNTPINVTIKVGCDRWGTSRSYLYRLAGDGKIIFRKVGRRTLVDVASGDEYFTSLPMAKIKPCRRGAS
jgi:hypothetical protein